MKNASILSGYYTIVLSYQEDRSKSTPWHPFDMTGPFSSITRGAFNTPSQAHAWAEKNAIEFGSYSVKRIPPINLLTGNPIHQEN